MSELKMPIPTGPPNLGFAPPLITPNISPAASLIRVAAVSANASSYNIPGQSRSVVDQNNLPCCVSSALGAAMELINPTWPPLAPLFHYYVTRYEDGGANPEGFLYLDNAFTTLTTKGICQQDLHPQPYTSQGAATKPTPNAYEDAVARALGRKGHHLRYVPASGPSYVAWIRDQITQNRPVAVGIQLPMNYPDSFLNGRFEWLNPDSFPRSASSHCVLVIGYSDLRQAVRVQDSRGAQKFNGGFWWMGYRVVDSSVVQAAYSLIP